MAYKMYIMDFCSTHFGTGKLDTASIVFSADRLFSALVLEAIKMNKLEEFLEIAYQDDFVLTDAFPFKEIPYLPKPIGYPKPEKLSSNLNVVEVRQQAKKSKKLNYIDFKSISTFLDGKIFDSVSFGKFDIVTKNQPFKDGNLFQIGTITYEKTASLYVIANQSELFDTLMYSLQFSGIGGKRSSGYGRFTLEINEIPKDLESHLTLSSDDKVMALTTCLPQDEELEIAMKDSRYLLLKFSGFSFSNSRKENFRKQNLYKFKSGSTFSKTFKGQIVDIRPSDFPHPVLNFAKPLFYKLEV
ncbi:MAG: type III-A CRISPR-associated RAMP protein Csm4 [Streptococcus sp.]|nr:type III-A CRISPR-associated RAMP protein Csm4 [Streptococcus sp.]